MGELGLDRRKGPKKESLAASPRAWERVVSCHLRCVGEIEIGHLCIHAKVEKRAE
jgi:hypothetical protein